MYEAEPNISIGVYAFLFVVTVIIFALLVLFTEQYIAKLKSALGDYNARSDALILRLGIGSIIVATVVLFLSYVRLSESIESDSLANLLLYSPILYASVACIALSTFRYLRHRPCLSRLKQPLLEIASGYLGPPNKLPSWNKKLHLLQLCCLIVISAGEFVRGSLEFTYVVLTAMLLIGAVVINRQIASVASRETLLAFGWREIPRHAVRRLAITHTCLTRTKRFVFDSRLSSCLEIETTDGEILRVPFIEDDRSSIETGLRELGYSVTPAQETRGES